MSKQHELVQFSRGSATAIGGGSKNLLMNGAMVLDRRNSAFAVTPSDGNYTLDRFHVDASATSKFSVQQVTDAPTGFSNSLKVTSLSAYTPSSSDFLDIQQPIEGFNSAQLNLGTANAKVMTLSFYVKSSLTGTFGGAFSNSAYNRSYPFTYTISAANTWERKTITLTGDTSGTWIGSTNGIGLRVVWSVGAGSGRINTAGAWVGSLALGATGQTNVVATNAATWQITGCQLEINDTSTDFEHENYGITLAKCERYFQHHQGDYYTIFLNGSIDHTSAYLDGSLTQVMRAKPSFSTANTYLYSQPNGGHTYATVGNRCSTSQATIGFHTINGTLNVGHGIRFESSASNGYVRYDAEL